MQPTSPARRRAPAASLFAALVLITLAGCYETELSLAPRDQAKTDPRLVGDWVFTNGDSTTRMAVRNLDNREYYVGYDEATPHPFRGAAFLADVKGATFAHVRELPADGSVATKHFLIRVAIAPDGRLSIRHLDHKFFEGKDVTTADKLRKLIEDNLDNAALYDGEGSLGSRVTQ